MCRYVNERNDDMAMESSYSQQQFEERRRSVSTLLYL